MQYLNSSGGSGFGHNFERATTRLPTDLSDSSAHHRVLRYKLGGLEYAVRFEVGASFDHGSSDGAPGAGGSRDAAQEGVVESLQASLSSLTLGKTADTGASVVSVSAISRGSGTHQACVAEIKSQSSPKGRHKSLPQLWFGRTRYLITGYHNGGIFDRVKVDDLQEQLVGWENKEAHQIALRKMVVLLSRLRDAVGMTAGKACVAIYEKGTRDSALKVLVSTSGKEPLPASVIAKFWEN